MRRIVLFLLAWPGLSAALLGAEVTMTPAQLQRLVPGASRFQPEAIPLPSGSSTATKKSSLHAYTAFDNTRLLAVVLPDQVRGKHEWIDYAVALSPAGAVLQVDILVYREKYGSEVGREAWRAQFVGKTARSGLKLHSDISNVSGATISCRHVTEGIQRLLSLYETVVRPHLAAAGRLPPAPPAR